MEAARVGTASTATLYHGRKKSREAAGRVTDPGGFLCLVFQAFPRPAVGGRALISDMAFVSVVPDSIIRLESGRPFCDGGNRSHG